MSAKENLERTEAAKAEALEPATSAPERSVLAPPVDIYEDAKGLVIVADMPGVAKDGVRANVEGGVLTIDGDPASDDTEGLVVYSEYEPASFHRHFVLGESLDPEGITAELRNGVLTVHLPKAEAAQTRKIAIKAQ